MAAASACSTSTSRTWRAATPTSCSCRRPRSSASCAAHGVTSEWGTELVAIAQDARGHDPSPTSVVLRRADGALDRVAAPWVIGTEGAHSFVRTTLDLPFEGHTRTERYALGDLLIDGDLPDTDFHVFSSEHGFMGLFPMGGSHFRLIASLPADEGATKAAEEAEPSLDELQAIYDGRSHTPARFHDMTWSSWFTINSRMVSRLKVGRLFIGDDAAHIHSPAGAQGMNTGIQDVLNLCWKLARVVRGEAPPELLDTYEADRLPVMRNVLSRTDGPTTAIGTENAVVRTLFNHLGPWEIGTDAVLGAALTPSRSCEDRHAVPRMFGPGTAIAECVGAGGSSDARLQLCASLTTSEGVAGFWGWFDKQRGVRIFTGCGSPSVDA